MNTFLKTSVFICVCLWPVYGAVDYTKFSHSTPKHKATCNTCHKPPTKNWTKISQYPDVADYPDHEACVSCHRAQFFKSAKPPICSVCHSKTSPRDEARYDFRNPRANLQFTIEFPHDRHQDVIALQRANEPRPNVLLAHAAAPQQFNNCTICHAQAALISKPPATGWIDSYVPAAATFKAAPVDHSSCFNCHWKAQEPVAANCNGCHKLAAAPFTPAATPTRISLKFMHEGGGEKKQHVAECTTCHINITKSATLRGLKPDVPITACTECHNKDGLRQDLNKELTALDKNRGFTCVYCHTSNVGSLDPPASHFLIAQRPVIKRK
jgi:decaheme cytochrome c component MtrC/MtrF-like protein